MSGLADVIDRDLLTLVVLPPSLLNALPDRSYPSLRTIAVGGEACSAATVARWANGREFINGYGPTEATVYSAIARCRPGHGPPPLGQPIQNTRLYVLDRHGQPVPVGVPGELYIGGAGVARGYRQRPDLTAERFVPDPFGSEPGARLYRTGDLVRWLPDPSANLEFLGRIDQQLKIRGYRIEPGEIESLLREHPLLDEAVVVARADGPAGPRLVAYVVGPRLGPDAGDRLRQHLQQRLPSYMLPSAFVLLPALPLQPNGKLDRAALPTPEPAQPFVEPLTSEERDVARIWADMLGLPRVGRHDDFFDLGGDSLLATRVVARMSTHFDVQLPVRSLFESHTVSKVATVISAARENEGAGRLVPIPRLAREQFQAQIDAPAV
jgi:acyl-coenzyme A synthetase/AMP-(fatty) acid ligase